MYRRRQKQYDELVAADSSAIDDTYLDSDTFSIDSPQQYHDLTDRGDGSTYTSKHCAPQISPRYVEPDSDLDETLNHPPDVSVVYAELQAISDKLKRENRILHDREAVLRDRERRVVACEDNVQKMVEAEVEKRWTSIEQQHTAQLTRLDLAFKEKARENRRLKDSFDTLKDTNESLRKQLEEVTSNHAMLEKQFVSVQARLSNVQVDMLEKQFVSVQARLSNLQRKQEFGSRQNTENITSKFKKPTPNSPVKENKNVTAKVIRPAPGTYDVLAILLDWVSDFHLRSTLVELSTKSLDASPSLQIVQEKCSKVLPSLVDILRDFPSNNNRIYLPCLQFIYWSLLHLEHVQGSQKVNLTSTLRRLGEELYKPCVVRFSVPDVPASPTRTDKPREAVFFRSPSLHVRFLSSLVILKTLSQVDHLAHVFDVVKNDLKTDECKELYIYYQATPVIQTYFKPSKALMMDSIDVFLQMSIESLTLQGFLKSCSNERWFQACSMLLRPGNQNVQIHEKLSIILQKLSKIRSNRKFFEVFSLTTSIQELLRGAVSENSFVTLNLKSILYNLKLDKNDGKW